jgi:hypothetical protein
MRRLGHVLASDPRPAMRPGTNAPGHFMLPGAHALLLVLISLVHGPMAEAATPSPANSSVDPCLVICPRGDFAFHVTVRDAVGAPIAGSSVILDFCSATSVHFCPGSGCTVQAVTDAAGQVFFAISGGGVTSPGSEVTVRADGVQLANRPVASPDQDGSLVVDDTDLAIGTSKLGSAHDYYHRLLTLAGDVTFRTDPLGPRYTFLSGEIWRNGSSPLPGTMPLIERFPRGGVPVPNVAQFIASHWNEAVTIEPVTVPGISERWTLDAGGAPYRFFKTAGPGAYSIESTTPTPVVTVSGTAVWLLERGIRAESMVLMGGPAGSALVIVAGTSTDGGIDAGRGFNFLGAMNSNNYPLVLVTDGIAGIEHRNNNLDLSQMGQASIFARDAAFLGSRRPYQLVSYGSAVSQLIDQLYAEGVLPGSADAMDPTMNLDCDTGFVDESDVAVLQAHMGHTCGGATPAHTSSWGRIKAIYR